MKGPCRFLAYITPQGRSPAQDFNDEIRGESSDCFARFVFTRGLLIEHGTDLGLPHWRPLGGGLGEIRWRCGKLRLRVYCSEEANQTVMMYEGDRKKWGAFPPETRALCNRRRQDVQSEDYDHEARMYRLLSKKGCDDGT